MGRYQLILKIPMYINKDVLQYVSRGGVLSPLLLVLLEVLLFVLLSPLRLIDPCFNATYLCTKWYQRVHTSIVHTLVFSRSFSSSSSILFLGKKADCQLYDNDNKKMDNNK